jgi:hypothetical protein
MSILVNLALALTLLQQPRRQARVPGGGAGDAPIHAVASFDAVFKTSSKKFVEIQVPSGDILRMYITRDTKFVKDGRPVAVGAFHDGDKVLAEAERDQRMNLLAVRIEAAAAKPAPDTAAKPEKH